MAVVFMEGFDHLTSSQYPAKGWLGWVRFVGTGRFSGQSAHIDNGDRCYHYLPGTYTTLIVGAALNTPNLTNDMLYLRSGGTNVVKLNATLVGGQYVLRLLNAANTQLAYGTTPVFANTWIYVEIKVVVSATVGTVELRLNGASTSELSASGVNTGALAIDNICMVGDASMYVDDIYAVDPATGSSPTNTWLGEVRVATLAPNGNGTYTAWTNAYTDWDDITSADDDTTYVSSSTPGDRETSTLTDLSAATSTVFAVQTNLVARKDDAGTRTIAPVVVIGGTPYDGTTTAALSSSYLDYTQLYDRLAPDGNVWDVTKVNAMETGVKEIA
jgi:hypothetical protein